MNPVLLRPAQEEDLDLLLAWENDPAHWAFGNRVHPYTRSDLAEFLLDGNDFIKAGQERLLILTAEDEHPLGLLDLYEHEPDKGSAYVGILIAESVDRRQGFGLHALHALAGYAKSRYNLQVLHANIQKENGASQGLFSKACYVYRRKNEDGTFQFTHTIL